jgi:hypothetical protein
VIDGTELRVREWDEIVECVRVCLVCTDVYVYEMLTV